MTIAELRYIINKYGRAVGLAIILPGILANVLTLRSFLRIGLEDTVTFVFFNLAIADMFVLISGSVRFSLWYLNNPKVYAYFMPVRQIRNVALTVQLTLFEANTFLTTYLAVQRCLCVAMPLRFKTMFSRRRTLIVVYVMWVFSLLHVGFRMIHDWMGFTIIRYPNSTVIKKITMSTHFGIWFVGLYVRTAVNVFLRPICSVLMVVCVVVMIVVLKKSVRFRKASSNVNYNNAPAKSNPPQSLSKAEQAKVKDEAAKVKETTSSNQASSSKERQVIVQVILILVIYLFATIPGGILTFNNLFDFVILGTKNVVSYSFYRIVQNLLLMNSAVNFLVYYKFNSKFRRLCFKRKV